MDRDPDTDTDRNTVRDTDVDSEINTLNEVVTVLPMSHKNPRNTL
jgi:hypothetical protein